MSAQRDPAELTGLAGWVVDTIEALGPIGVGALVALETVFPPIPSEVVLPVAGLLAGQGRMSVVLAVVGATVGSVVGALVLFRAGAALGADRLRRVADRLPLVDRADVERSERWFDRHGGTSVLIGRCVPVVRSLVSIPAGVERMPLVRFVTWTALGSAVYNAALVGAGYLLGSRWTEIGTYSDVLNYTILAGFALAVAVFVRRRLRERRAEAQD
ncbi:DedA family protein [Cellulomonas sp. ATA003]|uniref:DedA family protein n=1 Tax=Cellulomonas sp. ATA003 TaxID=3073064 RepID=UPI00287357D2|nr:DedA family protein [Cellulomonas sp. ATA003]WNB87428.1 DedA family protein [Cellulomonas sp. ATA003]